MKDEVRLTIRLPARLKVWLEQLKDQEGSSLNYEIIRSVRERMEKAAQDAAETKTTVGSA